MKKTLGLIFVAMGIGVLIYVIVTLLKNREGLVSPVPDSGNIKVIYITPGSLK